MGKEDHYLLTKLGHKIKSGSSFGIQGDVGSFNEEALYYLLGKKNVGKIKIKYLYTTERVLSYLDERKIKYGVFAFYNSSGGMVEESVRAMGGYHFQILLSFQIPVRHFLMKRKDVRSEEINTIIAHPQVFRQCDGTLNKRYPEILREVGRGNLIDTAAAARALADGRIRKDIAVLGPKRLVEIYNFEVIDSNLQDNAKNKTTFLLVEKS